MTRRLRFAVLALLVALGLSGCMKLDIDLTLKSDDTVDGSMIVAVSSALAELTGEDPAALAEQMQSEILGSGDELPGTTRVETYDDGEFVGTQVFFEDGELDAFEGSSEEELSIVREGDEFVVTGAMDLSDDTGDMAGMEDLMEMDIVIAVTFPGEVTEHNGELDGRTVTWKPAIGERNEISARGSALDGGSAGASNVLLIVVGILVLAVIAALVVFLVVRGRNKGGPQGGAAQSAPFGAPQSAAAPVAGGYGAGTYAGGPTAGTPGGYPAGAPGAAAPGGESTSAFAPEAATGSTQPEVNDRPEDQRGPDQPGTPAPPA